MKRNSLVIDTSAIIAEIKDEPGADTIREIMVKPPKGGFLVFGLFRIISCAASSFCP